MLVSIGEYVRAGRLGPSLKEYKCTINSLSQTHKYNVIIVNA